MVDKWTPSRLRKSQQPPWERSRDIHDRIGSKTSYFMSSVLYWAITYVSSLLKISVVQCHHTVAWTTKLCNKRNAWQPTSLANINTIIFHLPCWLCILYCFWHINNYLEICIILITHHTLYFLLRAVLDWQPKVCVSLIRMLVMPNYCIPLLLASDT